jgi:hypothetical protein
MNGAVHSIILHHNIYTNGSFICVEILTSQQLDEGSLGSDQF